MKFDERLSLILLIKFICLLKNSIANEVLGCGGFIKSHADIDFSKVEIKLLTKHGALKDKTDCSPSNGYYFLPIYDKGEYLLRVAPPPGWSFEPEQVEFNFDGKTDICSKGNDVNFAFKGFGITGKVALVGSKISGAHDTDVELQSEDGNDLRSTKTDLNGIFSFTPIIPGKYVIRASHPKWHFSKSEHTVIVVSGNTELPENSLVVSGFDVSGKFDTNGQINTGLAVAIFKRKGETLSMPCHKAAPISLTVKNTDYEDLSMCHIQFDKSGMYVFQGVPPGKYLLQPVIQSALKLHISPEFIEFEVTKDTLELNTEFKITGFSVSGKVLNNDNGKPLKAATIKLNGQKVGETDANGMYTLEQIKTGTYKLQVEASKLQFDEKIVKVQLDTPNLPTIVPNAYEVCGKVISDKPYTVGITKHGSTFHATATTNPENGGNWCAYLPNGKFTIEVLTSEADKSSGVQFFPVQQQIEVLAQPLSEILFSQLRATLSGELKCLADAPEACTSAKVSLNSLDASGQLTGQKQSTVAQDGKYVFKDILPGPYELTVEQYNLCFDSTRVLVNIASVTEIAPPFIQRGYEVKIFSSHRAIMKYTHVDNTAVQPPSTKPQTEILKLLTGLNNFCVNKFGSYNFKLESCHLFDENQQTTFSTEDKKPLLINAIAHRIGVRVLSTESNNDNLKLKVESIALGEQVVTPIAEAHKVDDKYSYRYEAYLQPEETLKITPLSDVLLFKPQSKEIRGGNDCMDIAFNFIATNGLIIRGKVVPAIEDVTVTLSFPNDDLETQSALTSLNGEFKFGPIDENIAFELKAEKESYVFSEYNRNTASFTANKLCEIIVKVKDEDGKALNGVLLSLSGAESYRKNLVTGENGAINFHSLSPSQYFLKPMMKEYKFEPNSKMIDIKDGETLEVELFGKRYAYSVYGNINSLNGDPFAAVNIQATADENCLHHQEEATSEANGQYRLRGLQPDCTYTIRFKDIGQANSNVERSIPNLRTVKIANNDQHNLNLIAISPLTFVDVTARITTSLNEHYKTLRLIMYRKGAMDSPIYSQRVETPLNIKSNLNPGIIAFFPRIPLDGKIYIIELRSSLSDRTYKYTMPTAQFVANTGSIFVELDFKPEVRSGESELNQNSISALVLVGLVAIAFFKQDIAMGLLDYIWSKLSAFAEDIAQRQKNNNKKDTRKTETISQKEIEQLAEQINSIKKRKTKKI